MDFKLFALIKSWVQTYTIPTNAVPLPLPRNQLASDVQTSLNRADNEPQAREQAINDKQQQINQLNSEIQATNQTLQTTDQNLSNLNTEVVAIAGDLQTLDAEVFNPGGLKDRIQDLEDSGGSGTVNPASLISGDTDNAIELGSDNKLRVPISSSGGFTPTTDQLATINIPETDIARRNELPDQPVVFSNETNATIATNSDIIPVSKRVSNKWYNNVLRVAIGNNQTWEANTSLIFSNLSFTDTETGIATYSRNGLILSGGFTNNQRIEWVSLSNIASVPFTELNDVICNNLELMECKARIGSSMWGDNEVYIHVGYGSIAEISVNPNGRYGNIDVYPTGTLYIRNYLEISGSLGGIGTIMISSQATLGPNLEAALQNFAGTIIDRRNGHPAETYARRGSTVGGGLQAKVVTADEWNDMVIGLALAEPNTFYIIFDETSAIVPGSKTLLELGV